MKRKHTRSPTSEEVKRVIRYLERHGLGVYGPNYQMTHGHIFVMGACRDYSAADVLKLVTLLDKGVEPEEVDPS